MGDFALLTTFETDAPQSSARLTFEDHEPAQASFHDAVIEGLSRRNRAIPCRFLYDEAGSKLFDAITGLEEYYPTRTEMGVLRAHALDIARELGPAVELIELGSGSSEKVGVLLEALDDPAVYVPIDISKDHLLAAARRVSANWPHLDVHAICADFDEPFDLPRRRAGGRRLAFYPGSTIGNFTPPQARGFLADWAQRLEPGASMLVGVDLQKDKHILDAAYNDSQGVTARFSLNLLARANRELGADFDLSSFRHQARYIEDEGRVAIHLVSLKAQTITIGQRRFAFEQGDQIHVEDSWKYTIRGFQDLAVRAGFDPVECWTDPQRLFSVHLIKVAD